MCYGGGNLRCPADSHQNNGIDVYTSFIEIISEFHELGALPVEVNFEGAEDFLQNKAKWHT